MLPVVKDEQTKASPPLSLNCSKSKIVVNASKYSFVDRPLQMNVVDCFKTLKVVFLGLEICGQYRDQSNLSHICTF